MAKNEGLAKLASQDHAVYIVQVYTIIFITHCRLFSFALNVYDTFNNNNINIKYYAE